MTLREIEPFAFAFKEADVSNIDTKYERNYRIACGFRALVEKTKIEINPDDWFVGPGCNYPDLGIHYSRGSGIDSHPNIRQRQKDRHP